jgi:glutathione synthase
LISVTLSPIMSSPTCFQEIQQQTGFDVPAMFVDALEAALQ